MSVCPATFIRVITFALSTLFGVNIAGAQDFVFGSPNASPITVRPPIIHETAKNFDRVVVSGGKLGLQLVLSPDDLAKACQGEFSDIIAE